jgi:hypothetical protein
MWIHDHVHVDTWICACGYTVTCTWIHGHMHIVHKQILDVDKYMATRTLIHDHMDTWQHDAHGYIVICMWLHGYVDVDTWPHADGYMTTCTWIHTNGGHMGCDFKPIRSRFRAVAPGVEPESVMWPTALS